MVNAPEWVEGGGSPGLRAPLPQETGLAARFALRSATEAVERSREFIDGLLLSFDAPVFDAVDEELASAQTCLDLVPKGAAPTLVDSSTREPALAHSGAALIGAIRELENVKNAAAAAQAKAEVLFSIVERARQLHAGVRGEALGKGTAAQIALARRESPFAGTRLLTSAIRVVREFPQVLAACTSGVLSEHRGHIIATESEFLSPEQRARIDMELTADPEVLETMGNKQLASAVRAMAYRMEPAAFLKRITKAESQRCVTLRPAADGMTYLSAMLPLRQGVAALKSLTLAADSARAQGDGRSKGQLMADALVHRLAHHLPCPSAEGLQPAGSSEPLSATTRGDCLSTREAEIHLDLIMTDHSLFDGAAEPAILTGYDPIPAPAAQRMIMNTAGQAQVWLRRLYTHPGTGELVAMDSKARHFPDGMKRFLFDQGQLCATPWCDAPIREYDHIKSFAAGGTSTLSNGQGLCQACNLIKETPGWANAPDGTLTTPTGHQYTAPKPALPGMSRDGNKQHSRSRLGP
ncbi:HNH endonuclease [Arthrobacter sp. GMC3]|uniref:HNH endonuclease n=1 Tax=Arthrobacter sp. GMC3 TaxID=2058894 RepID=UPI002157AA75|nr:HNH endonuclease [Arthrobacter sp. GMC3]